MNNIEKEFIETKLFYSGLMGMISATREPELYITCIAAYNAAIKRYILQSKEMTARRMEEATKIEKELGKVLEEQREMEKYKHCLSIVR